MRKLLLILLVFVALSGCAPSSSNRVIQVAHDEYSSDMADWFVQNTVDLDESIAVTKCLLSTCKSIREGTKFVEFTIVQGESGHKVSATFSEPRQANLYLPRNAVVLVPVTSKEYYQTIAYLVSLSAILHLDDDGELVHLRKDLADLYVRTLPCLEYSDWAYGFLTQPVFESRLCENGLVLMSSALDLFNQSGRCTDRQCYENVVKIMVTFSDYSERLEIENHMASVLAVALTDFGDELSPIFETLLLQRAMQLGTKPNDRSLLCQNILGVPAESSYQHDQLEKAKEVHSCG